MLNRALHIVSTTHKKPEILKYKEMFATLLSDFEFIMLMNNKMPTFMYMKILCPAELSMKKGFISSGQG